MGSVQVDVQEAPSDQPPPLGLDGDWKLVAATVRQHAPTFLTLENGATDGDIPAGAVVRDRKAYLAVVPAENAGESAATFLLEDSLYDLVRSRSAAIELDLDGNQTPSLLPYKVVAEIIASNESGEGAVPAASESTDNQQPSPADDATEAATSAKTASPTADGAARLRALTSPKMFPPDLQDHLTDSLDGLKGRFEAAMLFAAEYIDGETEFLVAFWGAKPADEDAIEMAVNTALSSHRRGQTELGITFLAAEDPMVVRISRVGWRLA
ncbi:MAG: hypothetical protein KJO42_00235 [Silicimonas sp.]|nr:hypothetical protein [Silicimonas sp.]NNL73061.1 hypothetical protein [Silicimonas sp.]